MISDEMLAQLAAMEREWVTRERQNEPDPNIWRWSPCEFDEFRFMLGTAVWLLPQMDRTPTFFEPGCGIGTKLYLAEHGFGLDASGAEIIPEYLAECRTLGVRAYEYDLRNYQAINWAEPDIVYTSGPFKDEALERQFETYAQDNMKPGGILIASFCSVKPYSWRCAYKAFQRGVWQKPDFALPTRASAKRDAG